MTFFLLFILVLQQYLTDKGSNQIRLALLCTIVLRGIKIILVNIFCDCVSGMSCTFFDFGYRKSFIEVHISDIIYLSNCQHVLSLLLSGSVPKRIVYCDCTGNYFLISFAVLLKFILPYTLESDIYSTVLYQNHYNL